MICNKETGETKEETDVHVDLVIKNLPHCHLCFDSLESLLGAISSQSVTPSNTIRVPGLVQEVSSSFSEP